MTTATLAPTASKKSRRRSASRVSNSRWAAYATAGAATALMASGTADASVHYSGVLNSVFNDPDPSAATGLIRVFNLAPGASFALDHNFRTSPTTGGFAGFAIGGPAAAIAQFAGLAAGSNGSYRYVARLGAGQNIAAQMFTSNFGNYFGTMAIRGGFTNSQWLTTGTGYIAIKFDVGAGVQYGWIRINMDSGPRRNSFTLLDYAYGDPGDLLTTGQVPEPGSLALLALGGVGLLAWRKRRVKAAAQTA